MNQKDALALINEIKKTRYIPSIFEIEFLKDIQSRISLYPRYDLSEKQGRYLEAIYRNSTQGSQYQSKERF